uniref:Putative secreted protein n=1 Tax=Rhipicephalus microplus TaxID=6941 RepID=A0A6M2D897_RHIMP
MFCFFFFFFCNFKPTQGALYFYVLDVHGDVVHALRSSLNTRFNTRGTSEPAATDTFPHDWWGPVYPKTLASNSCRRLSVILLLQRQSFPFCEGRRQFPQALHGHLWDNVAPLDGWIPPTLQRLEQCGSTCLLPSNVQLQGPHAILNSSVLELPRISLTVTPV